MKLVKIENTKEEMNRVKELYLSAFPANERFPFRLLEKRSLQGKADFWNLFEGDLWVGFAYLVNSGDLAYLFFFAIDEKERGKGYGTAAIKAMVEHYKGKRLFLALENWLEECSNPEERVKRHNFYLNCGLHDLPYKLRELKMVYAIMGSGGKVEPEEYKPMMNGYFGWFWRHIINTDIVK
ncbi:GNAT family N-acetyltransferase [bacterium]|nr:GNAT family N-acetyltransferase [bacterium]